MNQTRILLLEGVVQTMAGPVLNPGFVLVEDGKIAAVGLMADLVQIPEGTTIIDCQGQTILPGLIDAHCHLGILEEIYREDGDDLNEISDPVTPQLRALDAVNPEDVAFENARRGGVTSVCIGPGSTNVIGGEMMVMKTAPACFPDAQLLLAPAGLKIAFGENPKRAFGRQQKAPLTRMAIAAQLRQAFTAAQDYIHPPSTAPARDLKLEALARALQRKTIVRAHAHRADDIMTAVRIAEEFSLAVCIEHGTDAHKLAPELARRGIPVILGPLLGGRPKPEMKDKDEQAPWLLHQAGVKFAIMSDHPEQPIEYLWLYAALAVRTGLPPEAALRAITRNPAEILGLDRRIGTLEKGKDADLLVVSGSLLELSGRIERTMIDGKFV